MDPLARSQRKRKEHLMNFGSCGKRPFYNRYCCSGWRKKTKNCKVGFLFLTLNWPDGGLIGPDSKVRHIRHRGVIKKKKQGTPTYINVHIKCLFYFFKVKLIPFTFGRFNDNCTHCIKLNLLRGILQMSALTL